MWIEPRDSKTSWERLLRRYVRPTRRPRRDGSGAGECVEPPKPRPLSGGAAATLEFDD